MQSHEANHSQCLSETTSSIGGVGACEVDCPDDSDSACYVFTK